MPHLRDCQWHEAPATNLQTSLSQHMHVQEMVSACLQTAQSRKYAERQRQGLGNHCAPAHFLLRRAGRLAAGSVVVPQVHRVRDGGHAALKHGRGRLG